MGHQPDKSKNHRDWVEEMEVAGHELVDRVKKLAADGNVRRLVIRNGNGDLLIEVPLTPAVVVIGAAAIINPFLTMLGALAAVLARLKIEIERVETVDDDPVTIDISSDDVTNVTPDD